MQNKIFKRLLSLLVCFALTAACLPVVAFDAGAADDSLNIVANSKVSDPSTLDGWKQYFGPEKLDTEFAGAVWTDKSVFTANTAALPGATLSDSDNFLVALSAIASNISITGHTSTPTDTMLVLDLSGSMVDDTYEVGTIRQNNNYRTAEGIDMSLIQAMVDATNATIGKLMKQNTNNRVGVVLYSGNSSTDQAATTSTATVVLPLGRYADADGEYLSVDTTYRTDALYVYRNRRWQATGESATYVASGTAVSVSVKNGLKTESGSAVADLSKQANGGTYTQNGLYQAMNQFLAVTDTVVPEGNPQAGAERLPVLVLMTDGAPTIATTSFNSIGNSNVGDGTSTTDQITFLTQLTAAFVRGQVEAKYQETATDKKEMLFLTLGLGTENSSAATATLYPAGSNNTLVSYWNKYLAAAVGANVQIVSGKDGWSVYRDTAVGAMNYVDKYFYASNAEGLLNSFNDILQEIQFKAESYTTLVESSGADFSGYVTFEDELGEMMEVSRVNGILMDNGYGTTVLYTGKGLAQSMNNGNLGTVDGPTDRGNELVRTVKERIPGTTTTQAQQLINSAYLDGQLYYTDDNNWSNYIGWYADANGNYVGFWDKDSGYENAPAGAVYANRSYGYLGANGDSDMMHVVVMVRTELSTLHQTVLFKIPASLLPTVQYKVTLTESNTSAVEAFQQETALPMRLVFEVGLREDINSVNLEQKIAQHLQRGGHIHRNSDGTVTFYTNEWAVGNDLNGNGIPDLNEVETAHVAESHFHPALDNSRFYYTENTVIYDASGSPATARPSGSGYYYERYIYSANGRQVIKTPIDETTLLNDAQYDDAEGCWYIPTGTMYRNFARFKTVKTANSTETLDYSFFPAVFESGEKQDVYTFLGNNGKFTVAPATGFTLTKQVEGTIEDTQLYTFLVTLSGDAAPVLTDENGASMSGISALENGSFTLTLPANVTAYISGIPVGTQVQIAEQIDGSYYVSKILTAGQDQTESGAAAFTVPAYEEGSSQMVAVEFTNTPYRYGDLLIRKDVQHDLPADPQALATKVFTFQVTLSGNRVSPGDAFETSAGKKVVVGQDGVIAFEDGAPITLHNEESITIYQLPEGTEYTVTETRIPDGFQLTSATGESGRILGSDPQNAAFINTYPSTFQPVALNLNVTVNKILNGTPANPETFEFALQQLLSDNTYPDIKVFTISSDAADKTASDTLPLEFSDVGTYFYRIVEKHPAVPTAGMTYSTTRALFAVIVTDTDMDGRLEVAVREEANISASVTYTDSTDPETATDISVEAEFTNIYEVHSTSVEVSVHKDLVNNTGVDIPLTEFRFGIYETDAEGNATGAPIQTVTASALGDATFNLLVTEDKDLTYIICEIVPDAPRVGMTYSSAEYILSVAVEADADGQLSAVTSIVQKGAEDAGETTPVFENSYYLTPASASIPLSKTLTGRQLGDNETFSFQLTRTDGAYQPLTGSDAFTSAYYFGVGSFNIQLPQLKKAGTYHFLLAENTADMPGTTFDPAQYHISVTVSDNGNGALTAAAPVIRKVGQIDPVDTAAFVNTYTVTGTGDVAIGGRKVLNGRALASGEFTFGLYLDAECTQQIATASNRADGTFSFPAITYTVADLGEGYAPTTYTYYVKELPGSLSGISYDREIYTVTVTVSHAGGKLTVTPSDNALSLQITNRYTAAPVSVTLNGSKLLSGDWAAVSDENKTFTFNLYATGEDFAVAAEQSPMATRTVTGSDSFRIGLSYADGQEGTYYYVLKEAIPQQRAGGVGYDAGEYHITVNVADPGNGQLFAQKTVYRPGTGDVTTTDFTNTYTVTPTRITLTGEKGFVNTATGQALPIEENAFSFLILEVANPQASLENGAIAGIGYTRADGSIAFPELTYTAAGIHYYKVVEVAGEENGIVYDSTVFDVTVTVTDNGDGTLTANADYQGTEVSFQNTFTPGAAQLTVEGTKIFQGDWSKVPGENKIFSFALYPADADFTVTGDALVTENTGDSFRFPTQTYTKTGTYYYVLKELAGAENLGIQYSAQEIRITVTVTEEGDKLIPAVTTSFSGAAVTADENDGSLVTLGGLEFTNTYTPTPITQVLTATKEYDGKNMRPFQFTLEGEDSTGNIRDSKTLDTATATVTFDPLTFQAAGEYTFTVKEAKTILGGFIQWDTTEYTVTVKVSDNGIGALGIESITYSDEKGDPATGLAFHNGYRMEDNSLVLWVRKAMTGDATTPRDFTFGLYTDLNGDPIDTVTLSGVTSTSAVEASFAPILYKQADVAAGTYTYYIKELLPAEGAQKDGMTYDTTVYTVVVTLADDEEGNIIISYTVDGQEVEESTYKFLFENKYTLQSVTHTVTARKQYEGDEMKAFTFQLSGEGIETQTKQNDLTSGEVVFDTLTFTAPGTYTFQLSEQAEVLWDFIKWDTNRYQIQIEVVDNEKGNLVIGNVTVTSTHGRDDLVFRNVHEDLILKKDAFLASAPAVSIDGKEVAKGDVITYRLTYVNYTGTVAERVVITDAIPAYTAYVEGSADLGGIYKDGVITWTLENVPADGIVTVSFQVKVNSTGITVKNTGYVLEGNNSYQSNEVTASVPTPPISDNPTTGDNTNVVLLSSLMLMSLACLFVLILSRKQATE